MSGSKFALLLAAPLFLAATAPARAHGAGDADVSQDPLWALFETIRLRQSPPDYLYRATFPAAIAALDGQNVTISGFVVAAGQDALDDHFLLSRYSPECPYHSQALPNEVVEVYLDRAVRVRPGEELQITGRFSLQGKGHDGHFFRLDARALP